MKMQSIEDFGVTTFTLRSRDVINHVTNGLAVVTFLLVVNDDHVSILHCYGDYKAYSLYNFYRATMTIKGRS